MRIHIRNYREEDIPLIVVLLNAAEAVDRAEDGTSIEELKERVNTPGLNPEQNAFVAEDEGGRIVGFATLALKHEDQESGFRTRFNVHPIYRGRGLEDRLLGRLEERARDRLAEAESPNVYFASNGHTRYEERLCALERAGMKEVRRFWVMVRTPLEELAPLSVSEGLVFRSYRPGEDDAEAIDAHDDSFSEHFAHTQTSNEEWQYAVNSPSFRPDLTILAVDSRSRRIAGYCYIVASDQECRRLGRQRGWIDILGVRKAYRRMGLGQALLTQGLVNLRGAGFTEAALGCDSENTTGATRLYFRLGFQVQRTDIAFSKYLRMQAEAAGSRHALAMQ